MLKRAPQASTAKSARARAYSYVRMSTEAQLLGDSLRRQVERSNAYAAEHELYLVEDYHDLGVSAFRGANVVEGKLGAFLRAVKSGKVARGSTLLVESLDRLSRQQVRKSLRLFLDIIDSGINIVTLIDKHIYTENCDAMELMMSIMVMSRANEESETKRDRVSQAWAKKRANANTKPITAMCPGWLKLSRERTRFEVIQDRAKIVRSIFEDSTSGLGHYIIVKRLNESRVSPFGPGRKTKRGTRGWYTCSVRAILANRAVLGEFQPHHYVNGKRLADGDPIKNYFPPIIDEDLFYRAQQAREQRLIRTLRKGRGGRKGPNISNLFSGIARCAYCGSSMHFENKASHGAGTYLFCSNARRGLGCTVTKSWRYADFETSFLAFVSELDLVSILNSDAQQQTRLNLENEISAMRGKFASIDERMEATFELLTSAKVFATKKLSSLEQERIATQALIADKERELASLQTTGSIDKDELHEAIERLQNGDDIYKLRAEVAQKLRTIISSLYIATVGSDPLIKMAKDAIDDRDDCDAVIQFFAEAPSTGRFFEIQFSDGSFRAVQPSEDNPLDYHQQHSDADHETGSLPMNIGAFHQLLNEAQAHSYETAVL